MPPTTLEDLFSSINFITIFIAFLLTIVNVMVGVSMLPSDNRKKRYLLHRALYGSIILVFILFLVQQHSEGGNSILNYTVFAFLLFIVPLSSYPWRHQHQRNRQRLQQWRANRIGQYLGLRFWYRDQHKRKWFIHAKCNKSRICGPGIHTHLLP